MRNTRRWIGILALAALATPGTRADDAKPDTVTRAVQVCAACHGEGGRSLTKGIPSLAGQSRQYLVEQLTDFRAQTRAEQGTRAYMWGISSLLDDATIAGLADHYAAQSPAPAKPARGSLVELGRSIYVEGIPAKGVRACAACHGDAAEGAVAFPRLAGQRADYVFAQLSTFSTKLRPHGVLMKEETKSMTPSQMRAVADYVQSL